MGVRKDRRRYWRRGGTSGSDGESSATGNVRIAILTAFVETETDVKHPDHATAAGGCRFLFMASRSPGNNAKLS
jgi:hypothetical protein